MIPITPMVSDSASVSSLASLDNVSRSTMLRRQREAALRRHQREGGLRRNANQMPPKKDNNFGGGDGGRPASNPMRSMTTTAMADVLAWEESRARERAEARMKEEEVQRREEARMKAERERDAVRRREEEAREEEEARRRDERLRAAEAKAEAVRKSAELERYEREQAELKRKLAEEQRAREEAARRLEEEARRLAEAKAEAERLDRERLEAEATRRAELEEMERALKRERLERERQAEAERSRLEAERRRLAQQARAMEEQSQKGAEYAAPTSNGSCEIDGARRARQIDDATPRISEQRHPPTCDEEDYGHFSHDLAGGDDGYQRYLASYHDSSKVELREDATVISELTDANSPRESAPAPRPEKDAAVPLPSKPEERASKFKRSRSTRSLSFTEVGKAGQSDGDGDAFEATKRTSGSESKEEDAHDAREEEKNPKDSAAASKSNSSTSLQRVTSIEDVNLDDPKATRSFLTKPCPKEEGMIQCCIRRNKGIKNALFPEYRIYLKSNNNSKTETFLMTSKKRVGNKTSNYLISMSRNDHDKNSDSILGKLRSNFLGTEYTIYDHGKNPDFDDSYYDEKNDGDVRRELGAISYASQTTLGAKGPRKMRVGIGKVDDEGNPLRAWQPTRRDDERMAACLKRDTPDADDLFCMENKPPSWNEEVGAYVLNFNGRVTMASVKNFQLCEREGEQEQVMQFGRIGKDEFSLDVRWPMSLYQAFAVALSSFDSKLGCD